MNEYNQLDAIKRWEEHDKAFGLWLGGLLGHRDQVEQKAIPSRRQPEIIVSGGKFFSICSACHKPVRLNKPIIGSLHLCV